jgi:hypothetical protein
MLTIVKRIDEKQAARVESDRNGAQLMIMNNGYQWSGAAIYSLEVAKAAHEVLGKYIEEIESNRGEV